MTKSINHPAHGPVSIERLHQIHEILSKAAAQSDGGNLGYAMADAVKVINGVIAAFGAEPVAWLHSDNGIGIPAITRSRNVADSWFSKGWNIKPLYTTPPATVVPDEMTPVQASRTYGDEVRGYRDGWNACRAAMLQGADGNSPVIPDGWVLVPEEPTHEMLEAGDEQFGTYDVYRRMIAASPQQEVYFKTTSDERLMKTPDITGETVKVIGSFNDDGFCHKHPDTPRLKHPYMQLMTYPPRPATYCPECEPHVAEWEDRDKKLRKGKGV